MDLVDLELAEVGDAVSSRAVSHLANRQAGADTMIRKVGEKWVLYTKDGKRRLGTHTSRAEAVKQERAIKARKHGK